MSKLNKTIHSGSWFILQAQRSVVANVGSFKTFFSRWLFLISEHYDDISIKGRFHHKKVTYLAGSRIFLKCTRKRSVLNAWTVPRCASRLRSRASRYILLFWPWPMNPKPSQELDHLEVIRLIIRMFCQVAGSRSGGVWPVPAKVKALLWFGLIRHKKCYPR